MKLAWFIAIELFFAAEFIYETIFIYVYNIFGCFPLILNMF